MAPIHPRSPYGVAKLYARWIKVNYRYDCLDMGNPDSLRDWGHARDYVEMQCRMLRQESVRRFIDLAAAEPGWDEILWEGEEMKEIGKRSTGEEVVRNDPRHFRPAEVEILLGDPTKAREKLGWTPTTTLEELVAEMVAADKEEGSMENPPSNPHAAERARG